MLSARDITELLSFRAPAPDVLSVYLPLEPERDPLRDLEGLLKDVRAADADKVKVTDFVRKSAHEGALGLAAFSAQAHGLWVAAHLPQPAGPLARLDAAPQLGALLNASEQYQRFLVALVGEGQARFIEVFMGRSAELDGSGERQPVSQTRQAWLRWTADRLLTLARLRRPGRVILGAAPELASALVNHCHTFIRDNLILDPQLGPQHSTAEVAGRVAAAELDSRAVRESVLTHRLLDAAKAGMGVTGLFDTLAAVQRGQARLLLLRGNLARIGRRCAACRRLSLSGRKCDACGGATAAVFNVVAELAQLAVDQGCEVYRLLRDRNLDGAGGIGAELRFPIPRAAPPESRPTSKVL